MKTLIFFTAQFPLGTSETFIESEFPVLAQSFDKIFIVTNDLYSAEKRKIPAHVQVVRYPYASSFLSKILSLANFFYLQKEIRFMRRRDIALNKATLSSLVATYTKATEVNSFLEKFVAENKIDLSKLTLYSYWMNDMAAGLAMFNYKNPQVKTLCRVHGWDLYFERHTPNYLPLRNFIVGNLTATFCISENGKNYLDELTANKFSQKIKLARLGTFNTNNVLSPSNSGKLKLVSCSNIVPLKRVHLIIEALASIDDLEIEWVHFGVHFLKDEIENLAHEKLSGKKNIHYKFGGQVTNEALLHYYSTNAIDAFINVSETEGLPVSIMEANSFGIPAIATNVGGTAEIVQHQVNGFLLKANCTVGEIVETIKVLYNLPSEKKSALRKNAFEIWNKEFNAENNYCAFAKTIRSL